ncbi:hypothetical protein [Sporolactobacillus pectinivorans]|uniref:hypothetical protein n=1 Tax=Sporolactobacillus pectinivorans TaxID=1591408 RepID=UPI000C25FB3E|nr:hypothetical protein [Sporolactobacillus pectinivorans]
MIFDVPHRHMVFTVPKELRNVFYYDRSKLNELSWKVAEVFKFYYSGAAPQNKILINGNLGVHKNTNVFMENLLSFSIALMLM